MQISYKGYKYTTDIEDILEWHRDHVAINFPDSKYKKEVFREQIKSEYPVEQKWMIYSNDKKIGWIWLIKETDLYKDIDYCNVKYMHLIEEYRGQGIGGKMMEWAELWARHEGCKEMRLGTSADNKGAIASYEKAGFKPKRILMEREL